MMIALESILSQLIGLAKTRYKTNEPDDIITGANRILFWMRMTQYPSIQTTVEESMKAPTFQRIRLVLERIPNLNEMIVCTDDKLQWAETLSQEEVLRAINYIKVNTRLPYGPIRKVNAPV